MHNFVTRLSLPTKLLLIAVIPALFIIFLTIRLNREKGNNMTFLEKYLLRIRQSASISRLIDEMRKERLLSFEYSLNKTDAEGMMQQRFLTDAAIQQLNKDEDITIQDFTVYTFLGQLDSTRQLIDSGKYQPGQVIHYFSNTIFRLNTLNRPPSIMYLPYEEIYWEIHFQRLLSEIITYQGIINANIYTVLYTGQYGVETLMGTLGTYDVYKSYNRELQIKAFPATRPYLDSIKKIRELQAVDQYLGQVFTTYRFDSTYNHAQWKQLAGASIDQLRKLQMSLLEQVEKKVTYYYEKERASKTRMLVYLVLIASVLALLVVYILATINKSLKQLKIAALKMANGETNIPLNADTNDAIGSLASSIKNVDLKNQELALAAQQIGQGYFSVNVQPRSKDDILGNAIVMMKQNLLKSTTELSSSREEFRRLADFMPQIVWTARPDGFIDYYNKKWYEITGAKEGFGDQSWIPVLHPEDVGPSLTAWYRSVETGQPYETEFRMRDANSGSYRWFLGRALAIKDDNGTIVKWFGTATDIHDQKMQKQQLEETVAERTLELKRSNDDLQQFAHVASHDLKEPVRKIRTFSQRLAEEYGSMVPEKGRTYLDKIRQSSERMTNMIDSILSYSVVNATELGKETIDLNILMEGILSDLELLVVQKEAKITYSNLPKIKGIPTLIYQLFYNLVNNALKFTRPGVPAVIDIRSRLLSREEAKKHGLTKNIPYIELTIQDNGIGFDQEYADKIFNVFTRLNSRDKYEGTGLGLALCRKIVHRHGGLIFVKSVEGEGSAFHILLPQADL